MIVVKRPEWAWGYLPVSEDRTRMFRRVDGGWRPIEAIGTPVPMGEVTLDEAILIDTPTAQVEIRGLEESALVRLLPPKHYSV